MRYIALGCLLAAGLAHANGTLKEGKYVSKKGFFTQVKIQPWAEEWEITGKYKDPHQHEKFTATLTQRSATHFTGEGKIHDVRYNDGSVCSFPIEVALYLEGDKYYIVHKGPRMIPPTYNGCYAEETLYIHEAPYELVVEGGTR